MFVCQFCNDFIGLLLGELSMQFDTVTATTQQKKEGESQ